MKVKVGTRVDQAGGVIKVIRTCWCNNSNVTHTARWRHSSFLAIFPTQGTRADIFGLLIIIYEYDSLLQALPLTALGNGSRKASTLVKTNNSFIWSLSWYVGIYQAGGWNSTFRRCSYKQQCYKVKVELLLYIHFRILWGEFSFGMHERVPFVLECEGVFCLAGNHHLPQA